MSNQVNADDVKNKSFEDIDVINIIEPGFYKDFSVKFDGGLIVEGATIPLDKVYLAIDYGNSIVIKLAESECANILIISKMNKSASVIKYDNGVWKGTKVF